MKTVSAFEAKLLRCARAIVAARPNPDHAKAFAESKLDAPLCLSANAVELLQDTLAKGITLLLARGGSQPERWLRNGEPRMGRLWERTPPSELGLEFSGNTPALLCWLTAADSGAAVPAVERSLTVGDALVRVLAYRLFRDTPLRGRHWGRALRRIGLCRLFFPEDFAKPDTVDWDRWTTGVGSTIIEAFEEVLVARAGWRSRTASGSSAPRTRCDLVASGQDVALSGWLDAADRRGRWDLTRFLVRVGSKLLVDGVTANTWVAGLDVKKTTIADRTNLRPGSAAGPSSRTGSASSPVGPAGPALHQVS